MPIVAQQSNLSAENSAVALPRYAQILGYSECQFFGVRQDGNTAYECRDIWTKSQRDNVARYLGSAQRMIEDEIGYFLSRRWVAGTLAGTVGGDERLVDQTEAWRRWYLLTRWPYVAEVGVRAVTTIEDGATVDHTADPAVIAVTTTVTDSSEIVVYHPGTTIEIHPSAITIAGGTATISIPRCRMVLASLADNDTTGLDYTVDANFEAEVDVVRVWTDGSTNATLVWPHRCSGGCASNGCSEYTQTACVYVRDARLGVVDVSPASYVGGSWVRSGLGCACGAGLPEYVRLYYRAGIGAIDQRMEDAIVRLAHSLMPEEPCGCDVAKRLWHRDRTVPQVLTAERLNCPFGLADGAWVAYQLAQTIKFYRAGVL